MENDKNVLLLGASMKPFRYSHLAVKALSKNQFPVYPVGREEGDINGIPVNTKLPPVQKYHTVTVYLNQKNQKDYYEKIFLYSPERVIFNPGTENPEFKELCQQRNVEVVENCTLELLEAGKF